MAKIGKIFALIGGILTFLGTYAFSLTTIIGSPLYVNYGIGGILQLVELFKLGVVGWPWLLWVFVIGYMLYLLSFILQLIGMKSRIAAFFGSLLPLT